ncbi:hypothetical protein ABFS82_07G062400 [Erythranthe guttata]|nr:PREDICTED: putative F-box protein PP2-B12 [Erythranthe guttata]|eukprot:XP_012844580.1 PREDICTED: putative F-box protein PP2-B12 [Erythranthe guttata]
MSTNYDNWKRLLRAVRFRELDKQMILLKSTKSPLSSFDLGYNTTSAIIDDNNPQTRSLLAMHNLGGALDHNQWKAMLPTGKDVLVWKSNCSLSFFMDKNGKNCFLFGAYSRPGISPKDGLKFTYDLKSRFGRVAKLKNKWGVDISCSISAQFLSPETTYVVYLVIEYNYKNESRSPQKALSFVGFNESKWEYGYSKERARIVDFGRIKERSDRWDEVEIGRFYVGLEEENSFREERDVLVQLLGSSGYIIEGIEFRPLEEES